MEALAQDTSLVQKTLDLCQAVTERQDFMTLKLQVDAFMADEALKFKFQQVNEMGGLLQMKQAQGLELKEEEINQFEALREEVLGNPVATGFLDAQQQMQGLRQMVDKFLGKTFELGRRPSPEDVHDGSCGNCGCGH